MLSHTSGVATTATERTKQSTVNTQNANNYLLNQFKILCEQVYYLKVSNLFYFRMSVEKCDMVGAIVDDGSKVVQVINEC